MTFQKLSLRNRMIAMTVATAAILAAAPRETAPGRHMASLPMSPPLEDIVLFEQIRAWLEPSTGAATTYLGKGPLYECIQSRRESFELFIGAADEGAVRDRMQRVPYGGLILSAAERHDVDPLLVAAIVQAESSFNTEAVSPRGALGLMQMMPTTAEQLGVADAYDPSQNLDAGVSYLAYLLRRFDDDLILALGGYNAGPGAVDRFGGLPPFRETRGFANSVLRVYIEHHRAAWAAINPDGLDFAVLAGG
ncbi:MAG: lytic transglycosylase domain-containing protein [Holophagales bacterium]|nr:lytic transglycosylase domain-containing protein [Holophagales bacterium]MXX62050.1 lytic transglycosylase domain-containing protein [Holophagales bacterium]MYC09122.1 lytic transglycosylase domain-containing protein [Holophagales bacterium]MYD22906.1 lytic transglycosylase domain-containing protein [Holophagales bacterium]MYI32367.1 lytic transglycosylase domain-containing protein [Holophagales bacterium]